ncbi:MAG: hypothetical protein AUK44_02420 [Porphyromonadaceae bacterium CG2_30_38_12]|nr:MAG: hypothetical protein AUK44_02420 [Porphyromonadaceae bacterium CG2_30_38_12]
MGFLFSIFFLLLFLVLFVLLVAFSFLKSIFSFGRRKTTTSSNKTNVNYKAREKVFDKNEGEYTDYEEIK